MAEQLSTLTPSNVRENVTVKAIALNVKRSGWKRNTTCPACAAKTCLSSGNRKRKKNWIEVKQSETRVPGLVRTDTATVYDQNMYESREPAAGFPSVINTWWHWQADSCTCLNNDTENTARSKELPHLTLCPLCARRRRSWKTAAGSQLSWASLKKREKYTDTLEKE